MKRTIAAMFIVGLSGFGFGFVAGFHLGKTPEPPPTVQIVPAYPVVPPGTTESGPV